jgi:hypothetical protein
MDWDTDVVEGAEKTFQWWSKMRCGGAADTSEQTAGKHRVYGARFRQKFTLADAIWFPHLLV